MNKFILIIPLFLFSYSCTSLASDDNFVEDLWVKIIKNNSHKKELFCNNFYCKINGKKIKINPKKENYKIKTISEKYIIKNLEGFSSVYSGKGYIWTINNSISINNLRNVNNKIIFSHSISVKGIGSTNLIKFINYFKNNRFVINYDYFNLKEKNWFIRFDINSKLNKNSIKK